MLIRLLAGNITNYYILFPDTDLSFFFLEVIEVFLPPKVELWPRFNVF
jgi:hypothetical protein